MVPSILWLSGDLSAQAFAPATQRALAPTAASVKKPLNAVSDNSNNNQKTRCSDELSKQSIPLWKHAANLISGIAIGGFLTASVTFAGPVWAENELSDRYGAGLDTSLVDQTCLIDKCSLQAKACLADDPNCRKGLTCTAKCLGDNACITGCMARYGTPQLDQFLKCTIEDNECIKIAILDGGADAYGQEPRAPAPTLANFDPTSLEGTWYKVAGYNPNYDCYACQRNSFAIPSGSGAAVNKLQMEVEFSMPHLLPDGSPPPPQNIQELIAFDSSSQDAALSRGAQSIGLNAYHTRETMVFDKTPDQSNVLTWRKGDKGGVTYARTAHSEGEMFGLKFWENWYVLGENDPGSPEFKFIYYNGKTRQNTYEGAFVYSRTKELAPESMKKVYQIAKEAGMNPDQFCRIRNGCFNDSNDALFPTNRHSDSAFQKYPFRGILASTKVSEILGVEPVAARDMIRRDAPTAQVLQPVTNVLSQSLPQQPAPKRAWWYEVGDYLENPHRHYKTMDSLRVPMVWPEDVVSNSGGGASAN
ncbi:hypothetical protein ACA910_020169 [Epithemia clementina (nom. ined.)]